MTRPRPVPARRLSPDTVFWLLTAYKAIAALVVLLAGVYLLANADGVRTALENWSAALGPQGGLAGWLGGLLAGLLDSLPSRGLNWTGGLLLLDGALLAATAYALMRRSPAARPLVLAAIIVPLAPELYLLARHVRPGEVLVLLLNLAILAYVWRHYPRHH